MRIYTLNYCFKISAIFIWLILTGISIFNLSAFISSIMLITPVLFVILINFIMFGDGNIFKSSLDRSIIFMEKRIEEIRQEKRFSG